MLLEIRHTPVVKLQKLSEPDENTIVDGFRLVYGVDPPDNIVELVVKRGYTSVLEFFWTRWYIECSRVASHQLVRHRIASYWQESQRYVTQRGIVLIPRSLVRVFESVGLSVGECFEKIFNIYDTLCKSLNTRDFGEDAKQYVRYILPNACLTRMLVGMNLRELVDVFIPLRMCRRAQAEIRYIAMKMWLELSRHYPTIMRLTGPRCVRLGYCPERGITDPEKCRRCRERGYIEAIREHGTEKEIADMDQLLRSLP